MSGPIKQRQTLHQQLRDNSAHIKQLEQEVQTAQRLASLGTMACFVAHEFNNLLSPIINYAELALKDPDDTLLMHKALEKAVKQGNRASLIVRSILGFARGNVEAKEVISIAAVIDECFRCLARDLKKDGIRVRLDLPPELSLEAVPGQLQQVFLNLILNARHAMLERGVYLAPAQFECMFASLAHTDEDVAATVAAAEEALALCG